VEREKADILSQHAYSFSVMDQPDNGYGEVVLRTKPYLLEDKESCLIRDDEVIMTEDLQLRRALVLQREHDIVKILVPTTCHIPKISQRGSILRKISVAPSEGFPIYGKHYLLLFSLKGN